MYLLALLFGVAVAVQGAIVRRQDSCPLFCPQIYQPLCGSDGKTYSNECYFHRAQCMHDDLVLTSRGPCSGDVRNARGIICTTPWCWPTHAPVCGTDGATYENECELNNAMCMNEDLKVDHVGSCTEVFE